MRLRQLPAVKIYHASASAHSTLVLFTPQERLGAYLEKGEGGADAAARLQVGAGCAGLGCG